MMASKGLRVLSLFDGMGCGYEALKRAGIAVSEYHAYEVDKYAIQIAKKNHPDIIHHGEINFMTDFTQFAGFDLLIGGSPCQGFSAAGKGLNFNDPRSQLFFEFIRAKREMNPRWFMLENVKMKKEWLDIIDKYMSVKSVVINSALVSAQNRVRHYWCNWKVEQPADRGLLLRDIIEDGAVDGCHVVSEAALARAHRKNYSHPRIMPDKTGTLSTKNNSGQLAFDSGTTLIPIDKPHKLVNVNPSGNGMNGWFYGTDAKAPCLTTNKGEGSKITGGRVVGRKLDPETGKRDDSAPHLTAKQRFELREDGKAGCITTVGKDSVLVQVGHTGESYDMNGRIYSEEGKSPTLMTNPAGGNRPPLIGDSITYRKLTPIECERLQTLPDDYTAGVSNTQRYRMLGNGWTIEVIVHIFSSMPL
jgi:DNA (cytosine-5)-methyltransferase 3A